MTIINSLYSTQSSGMHVSLIVSRLPQDQFVGFLGQTSHKQLTTSLLVLQLLTGVTHLSLLMASRVFWDSLFQGMPFIQAHVWGFVDNYPMHWNLGAI